MPRTANTSSFSIPPALLQEAARIAEAEGRTGDALFRDMLRSYTAQRKQKENKKDDWVKKLIKEAQAEQTKNPMQPEELVRELKALGKDVTAQAKKLGINPKDVDRIIHEARKRWGTA